MCRASEGRDRSPAPVAPLTQREGFTIQGGGTVHAVAIVDGRGALGPELRF